MKLIRHWIPMIEYRLGAFGFLGGSEVEKSGTLNAGLCEYQEFMCLCHHVVLLSFFSF